MATHSNGTGAPTSQQTSVTRRLVAVAGALLIVIGLLFVARDFATLTDIEHRDGEQNPGIAQNVIPGIFLHTAAYLGAVNGSGPAPPIRDPFLAPRWLETKRDLERWLALAFVGLAMVLFALARPSTFRPGHEGASAASSIGADLGPVTALVAFAYFAFSFFDAG